MVHKDEKDVQPVFSEDRKTRVNAIMKLRFLGDHEHNVSEIIKGSNDIIIRHINDVKESNSRLKNYIPCSKCLGWFKRDSLCLHDCISGEKPSGRESVKYFRNFLMELCGRNVATRKSEELTPSKEAITSPAGSHSDNSVSKPGEACSSLSDQAAERGKFLCTIMK